MKCRFLFEAPTPGLLPDCPQCGDATMPVLNIAPSDEIQAAQPTIKFPAIRTDSAAR
jgi:hypothetical protein